MVKNISFLRNGLGGCGVSVSPESLQWEEGHFKPPGGRGTALGVAAPCAAVDPWHPAHPSPSPPAQGRGGAGKDDEN